MPDVAVKQEQKNRQNNHSAGNNHSNNNNNSKKKKKKNQKVENQSSDSSHKFPIIITVPWGNRIEKRKKKGNKKNAAVRQKAVTSNFWTDYEGNKRSKKAVKRTSKAQSTGHLRGKLFIIISTATLLSGLFLGLLYVVDIDKYRSVRDSGMNAFKSAILLLPVPVVSTCQQVIELVTPVVTMTAGKIRGLSDHLATLLNSYPAVRDHWSTVNEIVCVIGERVAEYMRTVYRQIRM